ncbi:MAG: DUF4250 domain-containing protein [Eubacteriales bacterium]|nr:DUF4250 domain-containing protein [Eubacteriales bacterium]
MNHLPGDPVMLYSVLNTKLRDQYSSFEQLAEDMHLDKEEVLNKLASFGFEYDEQLNQFR